MNFDKAIIKQKLGELMNNEEYETVEKTVTALPDSLIDDEILTLLCYAYINLEEYKKAIALLEGQRKRLENDYKWNFSLGLALYNVSSDDECENDDVLKENILRRAQVCFVKCMNLRPPKDVSDEAGDFLDMIENDLSELIEPEEDVDCSNCEMYDEEELNAVEDHIEEYFGEFPTVLHEIVSPDIHCDIYVVPPTKKRNFFTLITVGMGAHLMSIPKELNPSEYGRAELMICLPPDWKIGENTDEWFWPIGVLKGLARLPINCSTWLGWGHSIDNGSPMAGNTKLCGSLLVYPEDVDKGADVCTLPNGDTVNFFEVIPLYRSEMKFKLDHDTHSLLEKMKGVSHIVDINRASACEGYERAGFIDSVAMHASSIVEKDLPLDETSGCNHIAIFLRWMIKNNLYERGFYNDYPNFIDKVKSDEITDLRDFIMNVLGGELNARCFSYAGFMFVRRYYDYKNEHPDHFFPADVDKCAEDYFGTERYNSEEFKDEAYLFVPFDEDYYERLSKYIESAFSVFYAEFSEFRYGECLSIVKAAEEFLGCECIFPRHEYEIVPEMKKALADSENEDWFPHLICIDDLAEKIDAEELDRILYDAAEPFFLPYVIAKTPKKGFFDKFEPLPPFLFSEEIKEEGKTLENIYGRRPAILELSESCPLLMLPQGDGAYLLLKGK